MKKSISYSIATIVLSSMVSCQEPSIDQNIPRIFIGFQTEAGDDLFLKESNYDPFQVRFKQIDNSNLDAGIVFDTLNKESNIYLITNGSTPLYSKVDFGNGDVDTLEMRGNGGNSQRAFYDLSTKFDFFYNGELQVSWDIEEGVAIYHYDGGRQESIPKRDKIGDDTRFDYLLLKKDSASMADIGFE
jgi:hypothetical protein